MTMKTYYLKMNRIVLAAIMLLVAFTGTVNAQWSIYDGGVSPEVLTPRPFVRATNLFTAPDVFADHNVIVSEPGIPTNNLLRMSNTMPATQFLWRMNFMSFGTDPVHPAIDVTNLTVVMRVRGHVGRTHALDFDMNYNGERTRVSVNTADRLGRIRNGTGTNRPMPVPTTEWVIYRFAMTDTQTRVFVNENPVPVMTITPGTGGDRHFRIGDGASGETFGADTDWVIWDITGAYAPGEGTAVPFSALTPGWDVRLSDLQVAGTQVAGFHPAVTNYEVVLPAGTATAIPQITATANLAATPVAITQATTLPGVATITVTSEDGLTTRTYLVHLRVGSANADLSAITAGGTALAGFDPAITTYEMILPAATTTPPTVAATLADIQATMVLTQAAAIPGTATIVVTSDDRTTTKTYTINFRHRSTNANLSGITVGGNALAGFDPAVTSYDFPLPLATTTPPTVAATLADGRSTMVLTQATAIPGSATIVVTAEDGATTRTYTINFRHLGTNANLSGITVGGIPIPGFAAGTLVYNVTLPFGTNIPPVVAATLADPRATISSITQATTIPGTATILVTAEDGSTTLTYTVNFTLEQLNWNFYDGGVSPEVLTPRPFIRATNIFTAPDVFADHNVIVSEPGVPANNLLRMNNTMAGTQFLWRMNFAAITGPPEFPAIDVTNLTVVMRVRGHADRTHALDFDLDYNGERARVSVNTADRLGRIRNGTGTNRPMPVPTTEWVIYRFAMTDTQTRVFVNENPVPVLTITPVTEATNRHFRIGDGDTGQTFGADIDWVIWDITGAFAPGEGSRVPFETITPQWDIRLTDLSVAGTTITGFHPAVTNYEVVYQVGTTEIPQITASAMPGATVAITQATTLPGVATVAVSSPDGLTTRTYLVHLHVVSTNVNLSAITIGGTPLAGFDPVKTTYEVALPPATTVPPTVAATRADWRSAMVVTQATAIPGAATVVVTAEDGITARTYTINFRYQSANADLATLLVGGTAVAGFSPTVFAYNVVLAAGTTVAPAITATAADARATIAITQAAVVPGRATVVVTAEAGNQLTYEVNFTTDPTLVASPLDRLFRVFPNPASSNLNLEWAGHERAELEIISTTGKVMLRKTIDSRQVNIDIGHLAPGVYIIQLTSGHQQARSMFIKREQ
ncbi:MAG TPA: T9SS type A sorting domain-containing protein [Bacteroidales bacterium]|nr:T9SS type A sorting domain-containing protein [Bacteroidales bacterium]